MAAPERISWLEQADPERPAQAPPRRPSWRYTYPGRPSACPGGVDFMRSTDAKTFRRMCSSQTDASYGLCASCSRYESEQRERMHAAREEPEAERGQRSRGKWAP